MPEHFINKHDKEQIKNAFQAPGTHRRQDFFITGSIVLPAQGRLEYFRIQLHYIQKRNWLASLLLFLLLAAFLNTAELPSQSVTVGAAFSPFLMLFSLTELLRSRSYKMAELESCSRYGLHKIIITRLLILGSLHFLFLTALILLHFFNTDYGFISLCYCILTPFLISSSLSFFCLNHIHKRYNIEICGGICVLTGAVCYLLNSTFAAILSEGAAGICFVPPLAALCFLIRELVYLVKRTEVLKWNLSLTN